MPDVRSQGVVPEILQRGIAALEADIADLEQRRSHLLLPDVLAELVEEKEEVSREIDELKQSAEQIVSDAKYQASRMIEDAEERVHYRMEEAAAQEKNVLSLLEKKTREADDKLRDAYHASDKATEQAQSIVDTARKNAESENREINRRRSELVEAQLSHQQTVSEWEDACRVYNEQCTRKEQDFDRRMRRLEVTEQALDSSRHDFEEQQRREMQHIAGLKKSLDERQEELSRMEGALQENRRVLADWDERLRLLEQHISEREAQVVRDQQALSTEGARIQPRLDAVEKKERDLATNWEVYAEHKRRFDAQQTTASQRALREATLPDVSPTA